MAGYSRARSAAPFCLSLAVHTARGRVGGVANRNKNHQKKHTGKDGSLYGMSMSHGFNLKLSAKTYLDAGTADGFDLVNLTQLRGNLR